MNLNPGKTDTPHRIPTLILLLTALALAGQAAAQPLIEPHVVGPSLRFTRHSIRAGEPIEGRIFDSAFWGDEGTQHPAYVEEQIVSLDEHEPPLTLCHAWTDADGRPVMVHGRGDWSGADPTPWASFAFPSSATSYRLLHRVRLCERCTGGVCAGHVTDFDTVQVTQPDSPAHDPVQSPPVEPSLAVTAPKPGSYTILENFQGGQSLGYTRFEVEAEPCANAPGHLDEGLSWRITKTSAGAYFNAGYPDQLRFCASPRTTSPGGYGGLLTYLSATHGTIFSGQVVQGVAFGDLLAGVPVFYDDPAGGSERSPAALGGFPVATTCDGGPALNCLRPFDFDRGVTYTRDPVFHDVFEPEATNAAFYALLPGSAVAGEYAVPADLPESITAPGVVVVEQEMSARPGNTGVDEGGPDMDIRHTGIWHLEALAPNEGAAGLPGGSEALRARYMEYGKYRITEDWVWRDNGLVTRISQWLPTVKRCWRTNSGADELVDPAAYEARCLPDADPAEPGNQPLIDARVVETFLADGSALDLSVTGYDGAGGPCKSSDPRVGPGACWRLDNDQETYTLTVSQPSNGSQGYSGFLEVEVDFQPAGTTSIGVWHAANGFPIYVHRGSVNVPAEAYASLSGTFVFRMRPFFTTWDLDAFGPAPSGPVNANAGGEWSNWFQLVVP